MRRFETDSNSPLDDFRMTLFEDANILIFMLAVFQRNIAQVMRVQMKRVTKYYDFINIASRYERNIVPLMEERVIGQVANKIYFRAQIEYIKASVGDVADKLDSVWISSRVLHGSPGNMAAHSSRQSCNLYRKARSTRRPVICICQARSA